MKKLLSFLLAVVMLMSLVACGGNNTANNGGKDNTSTSDTQNPSISTEDKTADGTKVEASTEKTDVPAEYAKEITLAIPLADLDPGETWNANREAYQRFVFDTLIHVDEVTNEVTMMLAESVEWTDETRTALKVVLRDDIVFSNGEKVTTADVEFSFGRNTYNTMKTFYDHSEIISDTEMIVHMKKPYMDFYYYLGRACAAVVCKSEAEKHPDGLALIGSGPYVYDMDTHVAANSISLVRNEHFWGEKNPTEKINIVKIADASAAAIALQNGEINWANNLNSNELPQLESSGNVEVYRFNSFNYIYMFFNDHEDTAALTEEEKNFRRAVACAINREDIIAGVDGGMLMTAMWPFTNPAYIANESDYEHDLSFNPEKAKEYLAKAGGKNELSALVDSSKPWCKIAAQIIQEYLRQVGITMTIDETDNTGFTAACKWGTLQYDVCIHSNLFGVPSGSYNLFSPNSNVNRATLMHPDLEATLNAAQAATTEEDQIKYNQEFLRIVHDSVSYLPLIWREMNMCYTKGLENFSSSAGPCFDMRDIRLRTN